jgi:hypothetical protein
MSYCSSPLRRVALGAVLFLAVGLSSAAADDAWESKRTPFGRTAVGLTKTSPSALAKEWNVLAVGLFCGARNQIQMYLYGISDDRMSSGPVQASVTVDGAMKEFTFRHQEDAVVSTVPADFVRAFMRAKTVSVQVKDYNSPNPDALSMEKAPAAIRSALSGCFKP